MNKWALISIIVISCAIIIAGISYVGFYGCRNIMAIQKHDTNWIESLENMTGTIYWGVPVTGLSALCIALTVALGVTVYMCSPKTESSKGPNAAPVAMQPATVQQ